jgi:hypothetical protein
MVGSFASELWERYVTRALIRRRGGRSFMGHRRTVRRVIEEQSPSTTDQRALPGVFQSCIVRLTAPHSSLLMKLEQGDRPWNMSEAASAAEFAIGPRDREIAPAFAIVECAKKPPARRLWRLFASLPIRCIGRRCQTRSRVLI